MKSNVIIILSVLLISHLITSKAYPTSDLNKLARILEALELADMDVINEKQRPIENAEQTSSEVLNQNEHLKPKRGRQCLWKICSWSLEKTKKKASINQNENI